MIKFLAEAISVLSSPLILLLPTPYLLVFKETSDVWLSLKWTAFSYIFLFSMVLFVILGTFLGFFSDFDVSKKKERPLLFAGGGFIAFLYLATLIIFEAPKILYILISGIILGVVAVSVANRWVKVSMHTGTAAAFSLSLVIMYGTFLSPILLLPFMMGWARVKLKKHTSLEALAGGILGVLLVIIIYTFGKFILR